MGRSQRHLVEIQGVDSAGEATSDDPTPHINIEGAAGTNAAASKILLSGGEWNTHTKVRAHITSATLDNDFDYTPGGVVTPSQMATGLAAVIAANSKLASTASGGMISTLSEGGEVAHTITAVSIIAV